jgi:hypothetical protein
VNEAQFRIETADIGGIQLLHLSTGARFTIPIRDRKLGETIVTYKNDEITGKFKPDPFDQTLRDQVRSFVEREARARGLID